MFKKNFNAEHAIKQWANALLIIGKVLMWCSVIAAFIVLCCDAEYLWWVSLIILGGGGLALLSCISSATLLWGFGDVVGNTKRISAGTVTEAMQDEDIELPEL